MKSILKSFIGWCSRLGMGCAGGMEIGVVRKGAPKGEAAGRSPRPAGEEGLGRLLLVGVTWVAGVSVTRAADVGSEVHAVVLTTVAGAPTADGRITYASVPVLGGIHAGGRISSVAANRLVDLAANWSDGQFNVAAGRFYVLITSGSAIGWSGEINATLAADQALDLTSPLPAGVQAGDTYRVRHHITLASAFADLNADALQPAGNPSEADNAILFDASTKRSTTLFKSNVAGFTGWFDSSYIPDATSILRPATGWMLRRRPAAPVELVWMGVVRTEWLSRPIEPGLNLLGSASTRNSAPLSTLGLYTGNAATGVRAGETLATADRIVVIKPDGTQAQYYYSNAPGLTGWRDAEGNPAESVTFPAGSAFFLDRDLAAPGFAWLISP